MSSKRYPEEFKIEAVRQVTDRLSDREDSRHQYAERLSQRTRYRPVLSLIERTFH
jgi:transposase-like protein